MDQSHQPSGRHERQALAAGSIGARLLRLAMIWAANVVMVIPLCWVIALFTSDRWQWSQYLAWIPTVVALACTLAAGPFAVMASRRGMRRPTILLYGAVTLAIAARFLLCENHFVRAEPSIDASTPALRIVHWNVATDDGSTPAQIALAITEIAGDITIISHGGHAPYQPVIAERLGPQVKVTRVHDFDILTRVPILRTQLVLAAAGSSIAMVEFDTGDNAAGHARGPGLIVMLVDLPSNIRLSRMKTVQSVRAAIEQAKVPRPDVVVGDFNITRGSASIEALLPWVGFTHAYTLAGRGYAATFPRRFPLWHIDHTLVRDGIDVLDYDLIDPGLTRHRAQQTMVALHPRSKP